MRNSGRPCDLGHKAGRLKEVRALPRPRPDTSGAAIGSGSAERPDTMTRSCYLQPLPTPLGGSHN
jgi:hypothetical protein